MSTKTRNLQLFFRALSASELETDLGKSVPEEIARLREADAGRRAHSGLHTAVSTADGIED